MNNDLNLCVSEDFGECKFNTDGTPREHNQESTNIFSALKERNRVSSKARIHINIRINSLNRDKIPYNKALGSHNPGVAEEIQSTVPSTYTLPWMQQ
jgi:hypothetical protein